MSNKTLAVLLVVLVAAAGAAFGFYRVTRPAEEPKKDNFAEQNPVTEQPKKDECVRSFDPEKLKGPAPTSTTVDLAVKDFGTIRVEVFPKDAPKTAENFLRLAEAGYYDCVTFHRVAKNFVIQAGDPTGTGSGGQSAFGGEFNDELNPKTASYQRGYVKGVLAMANRGENTNTSQFFIMLGDVPLPKNYTIFGRVVSGQEVVDRIGQVDITPGPFGPTDGKPVDPVVIASARIVGPQTAAQATGTPASTSTLPKQ